MSHKARIDYDRVANMIDLLRDAARHCDDMPPNVQRMWAPETSLYWRAADIMESLSKCRYCGESVFECGACGADQ